MASVRAAEPAWELHLAVPANGALREAAERVGVRVRVLPFPRLLERAGDSPVRLQGRLRSRIALLASLLGAIPAAIAYMLRLRRLMSDVAAQVAHSNGFKMHALAALALPRGTALIWHMHDYVGTRAVMARVLSRLASRPAAAVANSDSVAADVRAVCGPGLRVVTVYNAVDLTRFAPHGPAADLDALSGMPAPPAGTVRVGLVATFASWKGHDVFLRALAALPRDLPVRGYVVGGALYRTAGSQRDREELAALARELGIADRVGFPGFVPDAAEAMRALDVVVHASTLPEPFGLVIAEAMACERAVIVSAAGGALEVVDEVPNAPSHAPGDAAALAARIAELARDPGRRQSLARAGRESAVRRYDRSRLARELVPLYRDAAGRASSP